MSAQSETSFFSVSSTEQTNDVQTLAEVQSVSTLIRAGHPFLIKSAEHYHYCLAIDGMVSCRLSDFLHSQLGRAPVLILSSKRGETLGFENQVPISMPVVAGDTPETLLMAASSHPSKTNRRPIMEEEEANPALQLLIEARLLPACLFFSHVTNANTLKSQGVPIIDAARIKHYHMVKRATLTRKSEAPIPVRGGINTRMVVFEYATGDHEIALMVGNPSLSKDLPIRIHSSCVTGDIFGSERCDCGDQLRLAIEKLDELGGGAVLYLDQEGRGIGLANKIRAYDLQDQSLDTVDANHALGFADDCRQFDVAAAMIRALGWQKVTILTNNPRKVDALRAEGIDVTKRLPHQAPVNENNHHYLRTKAKRSGHLLKY